MNMKFWLQIDPGIQIDSWTAESGQDARIRIEASCNCLPILMHTHDRSQTSRNEVRVSLLASRMYCLGLFRFTTSHRFRDWLLYEQVYMMQNR